MEKDVLKLITEELTVPVEVAGRAFGLSRGSAYEACKTGEIPSIRIGKRIVVPTAPLRKKLGIEVA